MPSRRETVAARAPHRCPHCGLTPVTKLALFPTRLDSGPVPVARQRNSVSARRIQGVPKKTKRYAGVKFTPAAIRQVRTLLSQLVHGAEIEWWRAREAERQQSGVTYDDPYPQETAIPVGDAEVSYGDEDWTFDDFDEFLGAYRKEETTAAHISFDYAYSVQTLLSLDFFGARSTLSVKAPTRAEVERIFDLFEEDVPRGRLADPEGAIQRTVHIFIGHGRTPSWRDLKDHLQDQHGFAVTAYEIGARAGYSIQEVLEEMVSEASFALLVHTGEDETGTGEVQQARQNVVHETGLFQGRLGFRRAIILREQGCAGFSNVVGTGEIRYAKGNIREVFGDVLATIYREFGVPWGQL